MDTYLSSAIKQFEYYKLLGEKTFQQLNDEQLNWQAGEGSLSIAGIAKHLAGNMLSRWTNFLTEDGEKPWRERDAEFEAGFQTKEELLVTWEKGWDCLFDAIKSLKTEDLEKIIYIRNMGHTVTEAINRQLAHYPMHVGQIVFIGKLIKGKDWQSLSIPVGTSKAYNNDKFSKEKRREHFIDNILRMDDL